MYTLFRSFVNLGMKDAEFSRLLAVDMYQNKDIRKGYFVGKNEEYGKKIAEMVENSPSPKMDESERRSRSMLNRNAEGQYKFAHKSIMEFFLAKEMIANAEFCYAMDWEGMEALQLFWKEMVVAALRKMEGEYVTKKAGMADLPKLKVEEYDIVYYISIYEFKTIWGYHILSKLPQSINSVFIPCGNLEASMILGKINKWIAYIKTDIVLPNKINKALSLLATIRLILEDKKLPYLLDHLNGLRTTKTLLSYGKIANWDRWVEIEREIRQSIVDDFETIQYIEDFLQKMEELKKHLPKDCKLSY